MSKTKVKQTILKFCNYGAHCLNDMARQAKYPNLRDCYMQSLGQAAAYNECAGLLATELGLASMLWMKPKD